MLTFEIDVDKKERRSLNTLDNFLIDNFNWQLLPLPVKNSGIDAVIEIFNKKGQKTGNHIWVEVKTGTSYNSSKENSPNIIIDLKDSDSAKAWKHIWQKVPGAMLLIYVDYEKQDLSKPIFYWVDLKNPNSYSETNERKLVIPSSQRLDNNFMGSLSNLTQFKNNDQYATDLPTINMHRSKFEYLSFRNPMKKDARGFYTRWGHKDNVLERTNPVFGVVEVNRVGWKHICRPKRKKERILQSFQLLPVAKEMIRSVNHARQIPKKTKQRYNEKENCFLIKEYFYLKARVRFDHRRDSIIYVILRKITTTYFDLSKQDKVQVWFYNIYEGNRGIKNGN